MPRPPRIKVKGPQPMFPMPNPEESPGDLSPAEVMKGYKQVRMPVDAWMAAMHKKSQMEDEARKVTGLKNINIPFTEVWRKLAMPPIFIPETELLKMTRRRRGMFR